MRTFLTTLLLASAFVGPAQAQLAPPASTPETTPKKAEPNEADLQTREHYSTT